MLGLFGALLAGVAADALMFGRLDDQDGSDDLPDQEEPEGDGDLLVDIVIDPGVPVSDDVPDTVDDPVTLEGGDGADNLSGAGGDDEILGHGGSDLIDGRSGDDWIESGDGNDAVWAGEGDDSVWGDDGNDSLVGQGGDDLLSGGAGRMILPDAKEMTA